MASAPDEKQPTESAPKDTIPTLIAPAANKPRAIGESVAEGSVYQHIGTLSSADMPLIVDWLDANIPLWLGWAKEMFKFYML